MKKTKLVLTSIIFLSVTFSNQVNGQNVPVTFGIKGGANFSTFSGNLKNTKSIVRYQFGVTTDITLTNNFYILTGLDFQVKGVRYNPKSSPDIKYNPMYLQLPVNIGYKFDVAPNVRLVIATGPYIAYGIGGKARSEGEKHSVFGKNKFKRLDYGVSGGAGIELGKIAINAGYDFGIANISDTKSTKIRNRNPYLTVGYKF